MKSFEAHTCPANEISGPEICTARLWANQDARSLLDRDPLPEESDMDWLEKLHSDCFCKRRASHMLSWESFFIDWFMSDFSLQHSKSMAHLKLLHLLGASLHLGQGSLEEIALSLALRELKPQ